MLSRKFKIQNVSFAMPRDQPATTYYILTDKRSPSRGAELWSHDFVFFVCFCSESLCTSTEGNAGSWVDRAAPSGDAKTSLGPHYFNIDQETARSSAEAPY